MNDERKHVRLRAIEPEDLELMYDLENDESLWDVGSTNVPYSRFFIHEYIKQTTGDIYTDKQLRLMIEVEQQVVGIIDLMSYDPRHNRAEVGVVIQQPFRHRGYATEALRAVLRACFDRLPELYRIEARHDVRNPASGRVMEKCGMTREGILRGQIYYKGEHADVAVCSVLRPDLLEEQVEDSTEP